MGIRRSPGSPSLPSSLPCGRRARPAALFLGLLSGAVYFAGTLYWLVETMTTFGGLSTVTAVVAALLLVAYLALFPAAFAVVLARSRRAFGPSALALAAPIWVATELGRQYVWDGFPWALLGSSQITVLPVAQLVSLTGVYGLSGLLAIRRPRWRHPSCYPVARERSSGGGGAASRWMRDLGHLRGPAAPLMTGDANAGGGDQGKSRRRPNRIRRSAT